jgi:hypothetical protein
VGILKIEDEWRILGNGVEWLGSFEKVESWGFGLWLAFAVDGKLVEVLKLLKGGYRGGFDDQRLLGKLQIPLTLRYFAVVIAEE